MDLSKPQFITFEGGEGCGKSTQSKLLYEHLIQKGIPTIYTHEVGGTTEAEKIRQFILHSKLEATSELMLVMAARYEHISNVIVPSLLNGYWVICDRFIDSTACYQSSESVLSIQTIYRLHNMLMTFQNKDIDTESMKSNNYKLVSKAIMPDITFFLDIPPKIGLDRAMKRGNTNKFELKSLEFHTEVYQKFKLISSLYNKRICTINIGNRTIDEVQNFITKSILIN